MLQTKQNTRSQSTGALYEVFRRAKTFTQPTESAVARCSRRAQLHDTVTGRGRECAADIGHKSRDTSRRKHQRLLNSPQRSYAWSHLMIFCIDFRMDCGLLGGLSKGGITNLLTSADMISAGETVLERGRAPVRQIDQRNRMHIADTRKLYALTSKANQGLCATYFTETSLEASGALNLKVDRIRVREGKRVCTISPSLFLSTVAGEWSTGKQPRKIARAI